VRSALPLHRLVIGMALVASASCASVTPQRFFEPAPARDWQGTLQTARDDAAAGRFVSADSVLAAFDGHYPGSPEAVETRYWRAVFDLDPTNTVGSTTAGLSLLDAYIGDTRARAHVVEARSLRAVAFAMDSLRRYAAAVSEALQSAAPAASSPHLSESRGDVTTASTKTTEADAEEIRRLRDELAKANEELERIKKRLAAPTKPPRG